MATIVQPYNPWREQLAANILGPLLGNMIQKGQEAEQNRKINTALGEWQNAGATDPMTGQSFALQLPDPLAKQDFTTSFESDLRPWANSFFDNGNMPQMSASVAAQPVKPQAPDMGALAKVLATPRFSMVNPERAYALAGPYLQKAEAARKRAEAAAFADRMTGIEGDAPYIRAMAEAVMRGYTDKDVLKSAVDWEKHRTPHHEFKNFNTNEMMYGIDYDPLTGQGRQMFSAPMGISEYQSGQLANEQGRLGLDWAKLDSSNRHWAQEWDWRTMAPQNSGIPVADRWKAAVEMKSKQIESIREQRQQILKSANLMPGEGYPPEIQAQIKDLNAQEAALMDEYNALINGAQEGREPGLSQDEGYNALPDEWKRKAGEWRKRGYGIQVHWYGENQCQIYATDPNDRDSMTQINKGQENIKRVKSVQAPDAVTDPAGIVSGDVRPDPTVNPNGGEVSSVTRAKYDAMCAKFGKEAVDTEMKRNGVPIPQQ